MKSAAVRMLAAGAAAAMLLGPSPVRADNIEDNKANCLRAAGVIALYSGTDAGAARRGLNAGAVGCTTADDPDIPYTDTNYLTPGATHGIVGLLNVAASAKPAKGTWTFRDQVVVFDWKYENSRWESDVSIPIMSGTGTVTIDVPGYGKAHWQKLA